MILDKFTLTDRVAIVTGAGQGLGEAIAGAMAEAGARVVLTGRTEATLEAVASRITDGGGEALVVPADVSNRDDKSLFT